MVEKQRKTAIVIEVAIPSDRKKDHEKLEKYQLENMLSHGDDEKLVQFIKSRLDYYNIFTQYLRSLS